MTTVQAWQHIYSNVEKDQSPQGRGGFQTLFYTTSGLTADEISEMEGRLLYFPSKTVEPVKRLFFKTTTAKIVVAQIVILPDPDQFGRKGRYLAHALVFTTEDFAKFESDPFRIFRQFSFFTTVAEVLAQGDFKTGNIPSVSLNLTPNLARDVQMAQQWSKVELQKLAFLTLRVEQQTNQRAAIIFAGDPDEIENALEAAFLVAPTALRPSCMFDAYFYRCNLVATFYWAIGLPEAPAAIKFALVDGRSRSVQGAAPIEPETAYERWILAHLAGQTLSEIARQRDEAFAIGAWLDGQTFDLSLLEAASSNLITKVLEVNPQAVQARLRDRIGEQLPQALVDRAADYVFHHQETIDLYRQLRAGFSLPPLLETLFYSYETQKFAEPSRGEVKALGKVLEKNEHGLLHLFVAYWRSTRRYLPDALQSAAETDYRQFVDLALPLQLLRPLKLLAPNRGDIFLDSYLAVGVEDWVELIEALIETGQSACLSRLSGNMAKLPRKTLQGVDRITREQPHTPVDFLDSVRAALAALPPEEGIKGFLRSAWQRLPGVGQDTE